MASKSLIFEQLLRITAEVLKIEADARVIDTKATQKTDLQTALARTLQAALAPPAIVQTSAASQTELLLANAKLEELKIAAAAEERRLLLKSVSLLLLLKSVSMLLLLMSVDLR